MLPPESLPSVEEFHGPYGPYHVSELVLQRIWLQRAFDETRLRDQFGRQVEVVDPGKWNRLEGPDFLGAKLRFDGVKIEGDVEVHFREADWKAHGHHADKSYAKVVLHLLYHECEGTTGTANCMDGKELPRVSLLPLLWYSLEEYAADDSLIASTNVDLRPEVERLLEFDVEDRRRVLSRFAQRRWELKLHFAQRRVERLGWTGACHQSALEVMGYSRNRVPMLLIAERVSLEDFSGDSVEVDALYAMGKGRWRLSGSRPANHPKIRLQQYIRLCRERDGWPDQVTDCLSRFDWSARAKPMVGWGSAAFRSKLEIGDLRSGLLEEVLGGFVPGQKGDTLVCDALLPLFCARSKLDGFHLWFHWYAGNAPTECTEALKTLQVLEPRRIPHANGWLQGMLGARSEASSKEIELDRAFQADA